MQRRIEHPPIVEVLLAIGNTKLFDWPTFGTKATQFQGIEEEAMPKTRKSFNAEEFLTKMCAFGGYRNISGHF